MVDSGSRLYETLPVRVQQRDGGSSQDSLATWIFKRARHNKLVLIEAIAAGLEEPLDIAKFGQEHDGCSSFPRHMQVGYDEALLSFDGETLIQRAMGCFTGRGTIRFAVYLHLYDPKLPLLWQGGEVLCPPVSDMPVRLLLLMPYHVI